MTDRHHVQAQLVGSPRDRFHLDTGRFLQTGPLLNAPLGVAGFAVFPIYFAFGAVGPIDQQGHLNVLLGIGLAFICTF